MTPGRIERDRLIVRFLIERLGPPGRVDLDELHQSVHPRRLGVGHSGSPETDDNLGPGTVDLSTPNLDHTADRDRLITSKVQHALEDQIGIEARGAESRRIAGFEREG